MPEINLPTKATQDAIKLQTDKIGDVQTKVTDIQNQFPISGGTDWSSYNMNLSLIGISMPTYNVYVEALNITGQGFVSLASITNLDGAYKYNVIFEFDGKTIDFMPSSAPGSITFKVSPESSNANKTDTFKIQTIPIFFNQYFKIRIKPISGGTYPQSGNLKVEYGLK